MRRRLAIVMSADRAAVALLDDGVIVAREEREISDQSTSQAELMGLLNALPPSRFRRYPAIVILHPSLVTVKRVASRTQAATRFDDSVQQVDHSIFFSGGDVRLVATHRSSDVVWGAGVAVTTIEKLSRACEASRVLLVGFAPVVALRSLGMIEGQVVCRDGGTTTTLSIREGNWIQITRGVTRDTTRNAGDLPWEADAELGARRGTSSPLYWPSRRPSSSPRSAMRLGWVACSIALAAALIAPDARAWWTLSRNASELEMLRSASVAWRQSSADLASASRTLRLVGDFASSTGSRTVMLANLAEALPDSSAFTHLRLDSLGGSATILSVSAAAALTRMGGVAGIRDLRPTGLVTRETVNGMPLQRVSVRFTVSSRAPAPRTARASR